MVSLRLVFLGTSSAVPTRSRALAGLAVQRGAEVLLFDAGEGVQRRLMEAKLGVSRPMRIFISHMHGDHCVGLLGLLQSMSMLSRERPLEVYGPSGITGFLRTNQRYLNFTLTFRLEVRTVRPGFLLQTPEYSVEAAPAEHGVPAFAYVMREAARPGTFYPERAAMLGIPEGALWSALQHGQRVRVGRRWIRPEEVTGPTRAGRTIGISGDTRPTPTLVRFFRGCDVLVFDSTYSRALAAKARANFHSTATGAARLAKAAAAKLLVLTHFSARYDSVETLVREAAHIHPRVMAAYDLLGLEVPYPESGKAPAARSGGEKS